MTGSFAKTQEHQSPLVIKAGSSCGQFPDAGSSWLVPSWMPSQREETNARLRWVLCDFRTSVVTGTYGSADMLGLVHAQWRSQADFQAQGAKSPRSEWFFQGTFALWEYRPLEGHCCRLWVRQSIHE